MKAADDSSPVDPRVADAVRAKTHDGRVTCAVLRKLAEDLGVSYREVGRAANAEGVKIHNCELGCF